MSSFNTHNNNFSTKNRSICLFFNGTSKKLYLFIKKHYFVGSALSFYHYNAGCDLIIDTKFPYLEDHCLRNI